MLLPNYFNDYKVPIYSETYINEKNILSLCYTNKLYFKDVINIIKKYLIEYKTGLSKFELKDYYYINNIKYTFNQSVNHPIYCLLRLFLSYDIINNSNNEFNNIIKEIKETPNNKLLELNKYFDYLINKNIGILNLIQFPSDVYTMLNYINKYICKLNISYKLSNYSYSSFPTYIYRKIQIPFIISVNNLHRNLEDLLIHELGKFIKNSKNNYIKKVINTDKDIIYIELDKFIENKLIIPKYLYLPPFIFHKSNNIKLELISIILYDINIEQYSIMIKIENIFYHFINNEIIFVNNNYFFDITSNYANILFYKKKN